MSRFVFFAGKKLLQFGNRHAGFLKAADGLQTVDMSLYIDTLAGFAASDVCKDAKIFVIAKGRRRQMEHFRNFFYCIGIHDASPLCKNIEKVLDFKCT